MTTIVTKYALLGSELTIGENIKLELDDSNTLSAVDSHQQKSKLVAVPGFFNAHVHAADIGIRGQVGDDLHAVVGPEGVKSRYLSSLTPLQIRHNIQEAIDEGKTNGVLGFADFREEGLTGLETYKPFASSYIPLLRPETNEIRVIMQQPGTIPQFSLGIRDVVAYTPEELVQIAKIVHGNGGLVEIHVSEDAKLRQQWINKHGISDLRWAVEKLQPQAVVHATLASHQDIGYLSSTDTGVIVCPSSNHYFDVGQPPVQDFLDHNLAVGLGSDNAMINPISLYQDMALLLEWGIAPRDILKMATTDGASLSGLDWGISPGNSHILIYQLPDRVNIQDLHAFLASARSRTYLVDHIMPRQLP